MNISKEFAWLLFILIAILFICCAHERKAWEKAKEMDEKSVYENFLSKYPYSEYAEEAALRIAKKQDTFLAYQNFLDEYPESNYSD